MMNGWLHASTMSNILAWSSQNANMQHAPDDEAAAEVDEPPDHRRTNDNQFRRNTIRRTTEPSESLLTKALHHPEEDDVSHFTLSTLPKRRSMNSSVSIASTADLTSDTGFTSPARTNTPSPPPPVISLGRLNTQLFDTKPKPVYLGDIRPEAGHISRGVASTDDDKPKDPAVEALARKRCISFACGPKAEVKKPQPQPQPHTDSAAAPPTTEDKSQRRTCIKFACSSKPTRNPSPHPRQQEAAVSQPPSSAGKNKSSSPSTVRKYRSPSAARGRPQRSLTPRPASQSPLAVRSTKYLTANLHDLNNDSSRFHAFATDELQEEDWIRQNYPPSSHRLTINDTLKKENEIRRLAKEAEEEELEEEEEEEGGEVDAEDDEAEVDEQGEDLEDDDNVDEGYDIDNLSGYGSDDNLSDGYNTDNEVGFADSDDDEDGGELELWTPGRGQILRLSEDSPISRRPSLTGNRSDSSSSDMAETAGRLIRARTHRNRMRPGTPELPDSTDFVCGTLDEDRALEDAYISCIAARRREKLHVIPQDIDPSFPTSEPEDEEESESHKHGNDSDDQLWIHGELEDLHHENDHVLERRKKRGDHTSPKRCRSPPPKRHHSPPPKGRGRSPPKRLFDRQSPRRLLSPPPLKRLAQSPPASLIQNENRGQHEFKALAFRPGLTQTKSLPRAPAMFPHHFKGHRRVGKNSNASTTGHVRGAIDIVKGLEQKRQRRKEKFKEKYFQKHCNRARKGQVPDKRPQPGRGAERMREIGLLMAGKIGPDRFVLSI
ncbi:hypothetical protein F4778DRAFT_769399 [Xylariomycetidae sp. FL2044]|nr:hypothetical protein F4778DRAFT_769399 [Xylariomycetidae sp. FL2044]